MRGWTAMALLLATALAACRPAAETSDGDCCEVTITATVPPGTGAVYLTGNVAELGPWVPDAMPMRGDGATRKAVLTLPPGQQLEYKFTLGSWDREMLTAEGAVPGNFTLVSRAGASAAHGIAQFKPDPVTLIDDPQGAGLTGTLTYLKSVTSKHLQHDRHVAIWLPPGYDDDVARRYPVLYMHDGQNLFDPRLANGGETWGVAETITALIERGEMPPVIVVGAFNSASRGVEYSPWHGAPDYARFLIDELMPVIDARFRTLTGPKNTAAMGSSMGGLLSYYLVSQHPDVFGACGCLSTHFPLSEDLAVRYFAGVEADGSPDRTPYILRDIAAGATVPDGTRYWFDYGTRGLDAQYGPTHDAVRDWLSGQGLEAGTDFVVREYAGADHNEASWRERLADPLRFLFGEGV